MTILRANSSTGTCIDATGGALDVDDLDCATGYDGKEGDCGLYDDADFDAHAMCCACGGGSTSSQLGLTKVVVIGSFCDEVKVSYDETAWGTYMSGICLEFTYQDQEI